MLYRVVFWDRDVSSMLVDDPTAVFTVARVVVALLGTATVAAVFLAGRRFFDRRTGVWAAAFVGFAYLPVFYGHRAINDVPTLLPLTLALVACPAVHERGSWTDVLLAGGLVGVAAATKYLAAPMALLIGLALLLRVPEGRMRPTPALVRLAAAALACVACLLALNPFIAVELDKFWANFTGQSAQAATTKLGQTGSARVGYPVTLLWGFGVVPLLLAAVGLVLAWRHNRARTLLPVAFPVVLYVAMAMQGRYFGRWMLPAYPALAVLAGYGASRVVDALGTRFPRLEERTVVALVAIVVLAQPVVDVVRSDLLLTRTDTRAAALTWLLAEVPAGERIVVEPAVPGTYRRELRNAGLELYPIERPFQRYELSLNSGLVEDYRADGFCWVMVNGHQHDRGLAAGLTDAAAYYTTLAAESDLVLRASPFANGDAPTGFSYDFSFNYYPPAHRRPGPVIELRHLRGCSAEEGR
ncbi:ArnT family glycosyltransferase [Nocardioides sp. B-3]|uniref:ArnT family glycosyltransferase n=1 Tax=Nocardioides sp. B-3 TaxID=2895565 RepID=UPI002152E930|nr:glycosyltransferase family 39 protein [Nocardioides sp. B-3]UUZ59989.1 glycosyltransferase family 39 protein [Nocardioides sp. B-3]